LLKKNRYNLIVMGTHGQTSLGDLILGSVTLKVVRKAPCPVMIVKDYSAAQASHFPARRILVPTDFSDVAGIALQLGGRIAEVFGSEFHFMHVLDLPALEEVHAKYWKEKLNLEEATSLNVDSVLTALIERAGIRGQVKVSTHIGDPPKEILKYAEDNDIDLILMGTHGRKRLEGLILGSVTSGVMSAIPCPVMTVSSSSGQD
jgi:nucleotide-binding universal stress UspA family protein